MRRFLAFLLAVILAGVSYGQATVERVLLDGQVLRVTPHGAIVSAAFKDTDGSTWRGTVFLAGHPKQKTLAEGDEIKPSTCERIGNMKDGNSTIRAYKFVSSRF